MAKITLTRVNQLSEPNELAWQERDALALVKQTVPNMRPGDRADVGRLWQAAGRALLKWENVDVGLKALIEKGVFELVDKETNLMLTDRGFEGHWGG